MNTLRMMTWGATGLVLASVALAISKLGEAGPLSPSERVALCRSIDGCTSLTVIWRTNPASQTIEPRIRLGVSRQHKPSDLEQRLVPEVVEAIRHQGGWLLQRVEASQVEIHDE